MGTKFWWYDKQLRDFLDYFHCACAETNSFLVASGQNFDLTIRSSDINFLKTGVFPLSDDICSIYLMFLCSIFIWLCDLDLWPFDLDGVFHIKLHASNADTNFDHSMIICSWVMDDSIWSHYHHMQRLVHMRRVTWPIIGGKNDPHFWNPWPQFAYSLCHFQDYDKE